VQFDATLLRHLIALDDVPHATRGTTNLASAPQHDPKRDERGNRSSLKQNKFSRDLGYAQVPV
jgi:hypothetical protein